jgi:preprotein translocase subunit YajC
MRRSFFQPASRRVLMDWFISTASAQTTAPATGPMGGVLGFLPFVVIFAVFYFLLIRPQSKRAKDHRTMVSAVGAGDEVVTSGGILGKVTDADEQHLTVEIADGVRVKVQRPTITQVLPKGTLKSL